MKKNLKIGSYISALFFSIGVVHATTHEYQCFPQNGSYETITFPMDKPVVTFNFNDTTQNIKICSYGTEIIDFHLGKDRLPQSLQFTYTYAKTGKYSGMSKIITNSFSMIKDRSEETKVKNQEIWQLTYTPDKYWKLRLSQHHLKCTITKIEIPENKVSPTCTPLVSSVDINQENAQISKDWGKIHPAANPTSTAKSSQVINTDITHPASLQDNLEGAQNAFNTPLR